MPKIYYRITTVHLAPIKNNTTEPRGRAPGVNIAMDSPMAHQIVPTTEQIQTNFPQPAMLPRDIIPPTAHTKKNQPNPGKVACLAITVDNVRRVQYPPRARPVVLHVRTAHIPMHRAPPRAKTARPVIIAPMATVTHAPRVQHPTKKQPKKHNAISRVAKMAQNFASIQTALTYNRM